MLIEAALLPTNLSSHLFISIFITAPLRQNVRFPTVSVPFPQHWWEVVNAQTVTRLQLITHTLTETNLTG
jgi:hypothetical protein